MSAYVRDEFAIFAADYISLHYRPLPLFTWYEPGAAGLPDADQVSLPGQGPGTARAAGPDRGPLAGPANTQGPRAGYIMLFVTGRLVARPYRSTSWAACNWQDRFTFLAGQLLAET